MGIFLFCLLGWKWRRTSRKDFVLFSGTNFCWSHRTPGNGAFNIKY